MNEALALVDNFLASASHVASSRQWPRASNTLNNCRLIARYGIFAANASEYGVVTTAASLAGGVVAQTFTAKSGKCLIAKY
jgi:hypothetical protein